MKDYTTRYIAAALLIIALIGWGLTPVQAAETAPVVAATASTVTLESSLVSIIQSVQTGVQAGVTFLSEEIPDVLRQLIMWKIAYYGMWAILQFGLIVFGVRSVIHAVRVVTETITHEAAAKAVKDSLDNLRYTSELEAMDSYKALVLKSAELQSKADGCVPKTVIAICGAVLFTIAGVCAAFNVFGNMLTVTQLIIAPKVWLIEYAASLVK